MATSHGEMTREQSLGEEIANSVGHGIGLLLAIAALPILVVAAVRDGTAADIVGASIFGSTIVLLYLASTLYHAVISPRVKRFLRVVDHGAIYLLIAGTYTPFTLGALRGPWGWTLFGLIWGLALAGLLLKAFARVRFPVLSTWLYIAMGWLALIAIKPLWVHVPGWGIFWLVRELFHGVADMWKAARRLAQSASVGKLSSNKTQVAPAISTQPVPASRKNRRAKRPPLESDESEPGSANEPDGVETAEALTIDLTNSRYTLPPMELLEGGTGGEVDRRSLEETARQLEDTLLQHGVDATLTKVVPGPTVTRYEIELAPGVKVNRVSNLSHDIAYALATPDVRLLVPIPGQVGDRC